MKILHSADWHLDSPLGGFSEEQAKFLRTELLKVPDRVAALCKSENCDLLLLAGDLFDGDYTKESLLAVQTALKEVGYGGDFSFEIGSQRIPAALRPQWLTYTAAVGNQLLSLAN